MTIAWFTSNKENTAGGMGVKVKGQTFIVESIQRDSNNVVGKESVFDVGSYLNIPNDQIWLMLQDENIDNYANNAEGIGPGSTGKISFNIKPLQDTINVDYTFEIAGYRAIVSESQDPNDPTKTIKSITGMSEISASDPTNGVIANYLNGHILLFSDYDAGNKKYKGFIQSNADMRRVLENVQYSGSGQPTKVTIYWVWPLTLSKLINVSGNTSIIDNTVKYDDEGKVTEAATGKTTYQRVNEHIEAYPQYYMKDITGAVSAATIAGDYADYGDKYDLADNRIGAGADYILLKMTVDPS